MNKQLGPIEVVCDAPPYKIVQACTQLGMKNPEDVRWYQMSHFLKERLGWGDALQFLSWEVAAQVSRLTDRTCSCGHQLPRLEKYTFILATGHQLSYFLGQCERCCTIFWEDA